MATLALAPHHWHGEWNYTLHPAALTPPPPVAIRANMDRAIRARPRLCYPTPR